MECRSPEFWAMMVVLSIMIVFALAVGRSYLRRRPSVATWRSIMPISILFLVAGAFLLWSTPEGLDKFPFSFPAFNRVLSILFLLAGGILAVAFYRLRAIFILHVSRDPLLQAAEAWIARSGLSWEDKTASVAARPWWRRPILLSQENARVWGLKPDGPELWIVFSSGGKTGPMAVVTIRGKGERNKIELPLEALIRDLRMIPEKPDLRKGWLLLLAGIGLSVVAIFVAMKCLYD